MSDLTTGQSDFPANWGFPSSIYNYCTGEYESGGMIWYGKDKCTIDDVLEVLEDPRSQKKIDKLTLRGTDDPLWTTWETVMKDSNPCYTQKVTIG